VVRLRSDGRKKKKNFNQQGKKEGERIFGVSVSSTSRKKRRGESWGGKNLTEFTLAQREKRREEKKKNAISLKKKGPEPSYHSSREGGGDPDAQLCEKLRSSGRVNSLSTGEKG